jgi:hypothetical protein
MLSPTSPSYQKNRETILHRAVENLNRQPDLNEEGKELMRHCIQVAVVDLLDLGISTQEIDRLATVCIGRCPLVN